MKFQLIGCVGDIDGNYPVREEFNARNIDEGLKKAKEITKRIHNEYKKREAYLLSLQFNIIVPFKTITAGYEKPVRVHIKSKS